MSDFEQKDNSGALFKNDRKETDKHPDYKGDAKVDGKDYWLSCWINTAKSGKKYMSLSLTEKEAQHKQGMAQVQAAVEPAAPDEDVPF